MGFHDLSLVLQNSTFDFRRLNRLNYRSMSINVNVFKFLPGVALFYDQFFEDPLEKRIQDAELLRDLYVRNGKEHHQFPWRHEPNRWNQRVVSASPVLSLLYTWTNVRLIRRMRRDNWMTRSRMQRRLDTKSSITTTGTAKPGEVQRLQEQTWILCFFDVFCYWCLNVWLRPIRRNHS